jgi:hypothetical protein
MQSYPRRQEFSRLCHVFLMCCFGTCSIVAEGPVLIVRSSPTLFRPHSIQGTASIPPEVKLGIVCELGGTLLTGDWKFIGTINKIDHEQGMIEFQLNPPPTNDPPPKNKPPRIGHLAYRLPHQLKLAFNPGDPITVVHDEDQNGSRLEWEIHISSNTKLILATSHRYDHSPPQSADTAKVLFGDATGKHILFYWSEPADNEVTQNLKTGSPPHTPISLKAHTQGDIREIPVSDHAPIPIELNQEPYWFATVSSELHTGEHEHHDSHAAPDAHALECLLIRQAVTDPR